MTSKVTWTKESLSLIDAGLRVLIPQWEASPLTRSYREYSRFSVSILHHLVRRMGRASIKL